MRPSAIAIVVSLIAIAACRGDGREPLRVGVVGWEGDPVGAARLALREVNAIGGIDGRVVIVDSIVTGGDSAIALSGVHRMLDEGVVAVIGGPTSATTLAIADALAAAQVPAISAGATSPLLTGSTAPLDYIYRVAPSDVFQARVLGSRATDVWDCTAIAIVSQTDAYGASLGDELARVLTNHANAPVAREPIDANGVDYRAALDRIEAAVPDCILIAAFADAAARIIRQWAEDPGRPEVDWGGTDSLHSATLVDDVLDTSLIDGMRGTEVAPVPDSPEYDAFHERFLGTFGRAPEGSDARTYDAMALTLLALGATGGTGGDALRAALYGVSRPPGTLIRPGELELGFSVLAAGGDIDYVGASGPVDFDDAGDVLADYVVWRYEAATNTFVYEEYVPASTIVP